MIQDQGHGWQAGPTSLSGMPPGEQARRLGLRLVSEEMERIAVTMAEEPPMRAEFPSAWDWRDVGGTDWITSIRDQEACGSCVTFGAVGVMKAMLRLHEDDAGLLETEKKQVQSADLCSQAQQLHRAGRWHAVVNIFAQIDALEPNYPDSEGLLAAARREMVEERRRAENHDLYRRAGQAPGGACELERRSGLLPVGRQASSDRR